MRPCDCGSGLPARCFVNFLPTAKGRATGAITITDNASRSPQTVKLTGIGTVPKPVKDAP